MSHYRKGLLTAAAVATVAFGASAVGSTDAQAQSRDILIGGGSVTGVYYQGTSKNTSLAQSRVVSSGD